MKNIKSRGYFGIGCLNMKTSMNYGSLFQTFTDLINLSKEKKKLKSKCENVYLCPTVLVYLRSFPEHKPPFGAVFLFQYFPGSFQRRCNYLVHVIVSVLSKSAAKDGVW